MSTWFQNVRQEWIRESVEIFGFINREHIEKKFGVSTPQASTDLAATIKRWPELMAYNASAKQYEPRAESEKRCAASESDYLPNPEAMARLRVKLVELGKKIDDMTDVEYGDWLDALPQEEFLEFVGLDLKGIGDIMDDEAPEVAA